MGIIMAMPIGTTFWRIVRSNPPTNADFMSHLERGAPVPSGFTNLESWAALSMFQTEAQARAMGLQRKGRLGSFLAEVKFPLGVPMILVDDDFGTGHVNVVGLPASLLVAWVARVVPL